MPAHDLPLPTPSSRRSRVIVPHPLTRRQRWLATGIGLVLRSLSATIRVQWQVAPGLLAPAHGPAIYCTWHNRLALCLFLYRRYVRRRRKPFRLAAMVSASKDGAFLAGVLEHFGVQPVRGSSSRRGPQALLEMTTWAERGYDLAVTPDGPRGPRYRVQEGVIYLAQLTGLPILPASYQLSWKICTRSWDRFQIPLPLSRVLVRAGELIHVPRDASESDRELLRRQLEESLGQLSGD